MEDIVFSSNYNNKLNSDVFCAIKLHNSKKYQAGKYYKLYLKEKDTLRHIAPARMLAVYKTKANGLTDYVCYLDNGNDKEVTINILKNMYKNTSGFNIEESYLDIIILKKIKQL